MIVQIRVSELNARLAIVLADQVFLVAAEDKLGSCSAVDYNVSYTKRNSSSLAIDYATRSGVVTEERWREWEERFRVPHCEHVRLRFLEGVH